MLENTEGAIKNGQSELSTKNQSVNQSVIHQTFLDKDF
jgi:hypothetical protein